MEIGDPDYIRKFGKDRVTNAEVLHAISGNPQATIVGDLETGQGLSNNAYDCMILTQTFHVIYDVRAAIANCHSILKTNGVLLATFPGISQISRYDMDRWGDYWRFTDASARRLFGEAFGEENVVVETHGNVLAACAFLHGLAAAELTTKELNTNDPDYQVIITVRAQKAK
jgi:SAM-dependent methyltransferase